MNTKILYRIHIHIVSSSESPYHICSISYSYSFSEYEYDINISKYILAQFCLETMGRKSRQLAHKEVLCDLWHKSLFRHPIMSQNTEPRRPASFNFNITAFLIASSSSHVGVSEPERGLTKIRDDF